MCHIPLITPALNIINKYSVHNQATGRLLPVLSNQKMNAYLKEIAAIVGINKKSDDLIVPVIHSQLR